MRIRNRSGFTLIELMLVVAILGVLAALAVPSLVHYIRRSRAAEAYENIKQIFNQASTYYTRERATSGLSGTLMVHCTVGSADNGVTPNADKQSGVYTDESFRTLGFAANYSYYRYELGNVDSGASGRCLIPESTGPIYVIRALGDLDSDGTTSLFELITGSNADNELYHTHSFHVENETE